MRFARESKIDVGGQMLCPCSSMGFLLSVFPVPFDGNHDEPTTVKAVERSGMGQKVYFQIFRIGKVRVVDMCVILLRDRSHRAKDIFSKNAEYALPYTPYGESVLSRRGDRQGSAW